MPTRILMASQLSDAVMDVAREILPPGYELIVAQFDSAEFAAALKDAEYYVGSPRFPLGPPNSIEPHLGSSWFSCSAPAMTGSILPRLGPRVYRSATMAARTRWPWPSMRCC
jgi:hypothetical protein